MNNIHWPLSEVILHDMLVLPAGHYDFGGTRFMHCFCHDFSPMFILSGVGSVSNAVFDGQVDPLLTVRFIDVA